MNAEEKRERIRAAWRRENRGFVPFFVEAGESIRANTATLHHPEEDLRLQEAAIREVAGVEDYFLPSLRPNLGIGAAAVAFGCAYETDPSADPWIRPLITEENPEAVYELPSPDPPTAGLGPLGFEKIDLFQRLGSYPVRFANIASPLLTASQIWEYGSFITALLTHPDEVHALLEKVTAYTLEFLRLQRRRIGKLFACSHEPIWLPPEMGLRVSDDVAALLPAELYREYGVRYNERLAGEFRGIVVHSCGDVGNALPAMLETRGLVGLDIVAPQNDLERVLRTVGGRTALCLRFFDWDFPRGQTPDLAEYGRELARRFGEEGLLLWTHTPTPEEARELASRLAAELGG